MSYKSVKQILNDVFDELPDVYKSIMEAEPAEAINRPLDIGLDTAQHIRLYDRPLSIEELQIEEASTNVLLYFEDWTWKPEGGE